MQLDARVNVVRHPDSKHRDNTVPDYLLDISLQEVYNYYYNWHPNETNTLETQVREWYKTARGWTWEAL